MWCVVSKARFAASIVLGCLMGATAPCLAADTRPDDRGDWFRDPDTRDSNHDGQDLDTGKPASAPDREARHGEDDSTWRRNSTVRPPYAGGYGPYAPQENYGQYNDYPGYIANDWVNATVRAATARAVSPCPDRA